MAACAGFQIPVNFQLARVVFGLHLGKGDARKKLLIGIEPGIKNSNGFPLTGQAIAVGLMNIREFKGVHAAKRRCARKKKYLPVLAQVFEFLFRRKGIDLSLAVRATGS